jgi:hypothetical protein
MESPSSFFDVTKSNIFVWVVGSLLLSLIVLELCRGLWELVKQAVAAPANKRPPHEEEETDPPRRTRRVITRE